MIVCVLCIIGSYVLSSSLATSLIGILVKIMLSALFTIVVFSVMLGRTNEYKFCIGKINGLVRTVGKN